jgi:alcohol dehydrogenase class IV
MGGRVDRMDEALRLLSLQVTEIRATSHGGEDREAKARSMFATVMAGLAVAVAVASLVLPLILR